MSNFNTIKIFGLIISFVCFSCLSENENSSYRNDIYKTIVTNNNITDLGLIKAALSNSDTTVLKNIDAYKIDNYEAFSSTYRNYKDSIGIDSSFFDQNQLVSFFLTTVGGDAIDSYNFYIVSDTLILNCKIKLWNKNYGIKLASSYVITFKSNKLNQ